MLEVSLEVGPLRWSLVLRTPEPDHPGPPNPTDARSELAGPDPGAVSLRWRGT